MLVESLHPRVPFKNLYFSSDASALVQAVFACLQRRVSCTAIPYERFGAPSHIVVRGITKDDYAALKAGNFVGWWESRTQTARLSHAPRWWLFRNGQAPSGWDGVYSLTTRDGVYFPRVSLWDSLSEAVPAVERYGDEVRYGPFVLRPDDALLTLRPLTRRLPAPAKEVASVLWPLGAPPSGKVASCPGGFWHGAEAARLFDATPQPGCCAGYLADVATWAPSRLAAYAARTQATRLEWHGPGRALATWPLAPALPAVPRVAISDKKSLGFFTQAVVSVRAAPLVRLGGLSF